MAKSQRQRILSAAKLRSEEVYVDAWDETVEVRELAEAHLRGLRAKMSDDPDPMDFRLNLVMASVVNGNGDRMFKDEDEETLRQGPSSAITQVFDAAARLNGLEPEDLAGN